MTRAKAMGLAWVLVGLVSWFGTTWANAGTDEGLDLFERKIRPVLVEECAECHSAQSKSVKGGLRLDSRAGMLAGGDSGPALVPGKPEESLLLEALRHEGLEMPPRRKLPTTVVADFERWIRLGAPDPRVDIPVARPARKGIDLEAGRQFWAYRPPKRHEPPRVADLAWPCNAIDYFVLNALEAKGLRPAPDADRPTLIRRLWFDLLGLPPSPEEIRAFEADASPLAYERLVDRLLAAPHFGERWGRHWLDVVRFAESLTLRGFVFGQAWRYRDFVVDSFNADRPIDEFLREQVAGDLLQGGDLETRRRRRIATAFLVLGNINLEEQDKAQLRMDMVDEQLDTIGKALLGQTLGCARCHDHKFDPIPTRDYYALAGILRNTRSMEHANVSKWLEFPLPEAPERESELNRQEAAIADLAKKVAALQTRDSSMKAVGVLEPTSLPGAVVDDAQARKVGGWTDSTFSGTYIGKGYVHDGNTGKGACSITFEPDLPVTGVYEVWLAYSPGASRASSVPVTVMSAEGEKQVAVDMRAAPPLERRFVTLGKHRFEKGGQSYVLITNEGTEGHVTADAVLFLPAGKAPRLADSATSGELRTMRARLERLRAEAPRRPMAMSVVDESEIVDTRVHVRGSVHTLGEIAPRGFLSVVSRGPAPAMPSRASGRAELADWLASRDNPLTARVFANRAWHWLIGAGLVRTTDNFGTTGEPPSHPELLDDLAARFVENCWSSKTLIREIVLSRTYRQASATDARIVASDPENRLLSRANRRRLDAECLRDAMLVAAGRLSTEMAGPSFPSTLAADYGFEYKGARRSLYVPVFRNALPDLFEVFDFADPSMVVGRRNVSTIAPQALYLLNNPFVMEQARHAAAALLAVPELDPRGRLDRAFVSTLGRRPTSQERSLAEGFLGRSGKRPEDTWALLFQSLFGSIDFRYSN